MIILHTVDYNIYTVFIKLFSIFITLLSVFCLLHCKFAKTGKTQQFQEVNGLCHSPAQEL